MRETSGTLSSAIAMGIAAGLVGTGAMMAIRSFDERYAPESIAKTRKDPGRFMVQTAEHYTGTSGLLCEPMEQAAAMATHTAYGTMFGVLYSLWRGRGKRKSALADGILVGTTVYSIGYLGWLPALGLGKPIWKQSFPQIAGGLFRHGVYGVATAAVYGLLDNFV